MVGRSKLSVPWDRTEAMANFQQPMAYGASWVV